jgi:hypothetical protein
MTAHIENHSTTEDLEIEGFGTLPPGGKQLFVYDNGWSKIEKNPPITMDDVLTGKGKMEDYIIQEWAKNLMEKIASDDSAEEEAIEQLIRERDKPTCKCASLLNGHEPGCPVAGME